MVTINVFHNIAVILKPEDTKVTALEAGENEVPEIIAKRLVNVGAAELVDAGQD